MNVLISRRGLGRWLAGMLLARQAGVEVPVPVVEELPLVEAVPITVAESSDPVARAFLEALIEEGSVAIYYHGGSTPGAWRLVRPESVYRLSPGGRIYVRGNCELRGGQRTFRLERARMG
ncbi:WYL domain-containing protein [Luteolibacter sp. Populi]|uniref:WYL domain-containing protein n=1 Tax=Luteolibacter sp. Populi TaxID=3230487 RepID=UPI0034653A74